ncbi:unnamed protein product [Vicia faba]|uniref:TF-B3 domain-containing protein n=1 Tax=Vicia faba TaxID=3906 RepID=A0AAV0ZEH1_VICFA|nr:unnamed protein product [Vicia faba]
MRFLTLLIYLSNRIHLAKDEQDLSQKCMCNDIKYLAFEESQSVKKCKTKLSHGEEATKGNTQVGVVPEKGVYSPIYEEHFEENWSREVTDPKKLSSNVLERGVERYLLGEWYDFAKDVHLKVGDKLHFCICYPPVDEILGSVERGNATRGWR